jgi:hypothetical protein
LDALRIIESGGLYFSLYASRLFELYQPGVRFSGEVVFGVVNFSNQAENCMRLVAC